MFRVYLSPSLQTSNVYPANIGGNEEQHMRAVAIAAKHYLDEDGRFTVRLSRRSWRSASGGDIGRVVADANAWRPKLHIAIHSDAAAASADGTITFYLTQSARGKALARRVQTKVGAVSPGTDYGIRAQTGWGELYINADVAYTEIGFHTNRFEAQDIADHHEKYGLAIAQAAALHCGVRLNRKVPLTAAERKRLRKRLANATAASLRWLRRLVTRLLK